MRGVAQKEDIEISAQVSPLSTGVNIVLFLT